MPKTALGVYISQKNVDIIEIAGSKNAPVFMNFIRQEIPPAVTVVDADMAEKNLSEQDAIAIAVKEGFEKLHLKPRDVQTVLASSDIMIRYFDMPVLPKSEQSQAVRFEAKKYIPFKLEEITSDFKISIESKNKKAMDIFFIAATKVQINVHVARFKHTKAVVSGIDIMPLALWRVLLLHKKVEPKERLVILYADNDRASVSIHIIESGMPFMSRDFKVSIDDKEAVFEKIVSELRVSIDYYCRQKHNMKIEKIITCGEMLFSGLDTYIADELSIVTGSLYDFNKVKNSDTVLPSAIVALGTALEGLGRSNYSVNFSPFSAAIKHKKTYNIVTMECIAALVIIVLFYILNNMLIKNIAVNLKAISNQAESLPANTLRLSVEKLTARKEEMLKDTQLLSLVVNNRVSWAVKLVSIASDLSARNKEASSGVWLNSLAMKESFIQGDSIYPSDIAREIFMSGRSFSSDTSKGMVCINEFFITLKKNVKFMEHLDNIDLGSVDKQDMEGYLVSTFAISAYSGKAIHAASAPSKSRKIGRR